MERTLGVTLTQEKVTICKSLFVNDVISPPITFISASGTEFTEYLHSSSHFWKPYFSISAYHSDSRKGWINQGRISNTSGAFPARLTCCASCQRVTLSPEDKNPSREPSKTGRICRSAVVTGKRSAPL